MKLIRNICILALALCVVCALTAAYADTLAIPSGTTAIGEEAFFGDSSLSAVSLPDGLLSIGTRAFAQSGVTSVNLPDTLTFIADDAFDNTPVTTLTVNEGTYA